MSRQALPWLQRDAPTCLVGDRGPTWPAFRRLAFRPRRRLLRPIWQPCLPSCSAKIVGFLSKKRKILKELGKVSRGLHQRSICEDFVTSHDGYANRAFDFPPHGLSEGSWTHLPPDTFPILIARKDHPSFFCEGPVDT